MVRDVATVGDERCEHHRRSHTVGDVVAVIERRLAQQGSLEHAHHVAVHRNRRSVLRNGVEFRLAEHVLGRPVEADVVVAIGVAEGVGAG